MKLNHEQKLHYGSENNQESRESHVDTLLEYNHIGKEDSLSRNISLRSYYLCSVRTWERIKPGKPSGRGV